MHACEYVYGCSGCISEISSRGQQSGKESKKDKRKNSRRQTTGGKREAKGKVCASHERKNMKSLLLGDDDDEHTNGQNTKENPP